MPIFHTAKITQILEVGELTKKVSSIPRKNKNELILVVGQTGLTPKQV